MVSMDRNTMGSKERRGHNIHNIRRDHRGNHPYMVPTTATTMLLMARMSLMGNLDKLDIRGMGTDIQHNQSLMDIQGIRGILTMPATSIIHSPTIPIRTMGNL